MARISDRRDWFELWKEDKDSMLSCMVRNLSADLDAGYNYFGNSVKRQQEQINQYKKEYDEQIGKFYEMDKKSVNRWCLYDMLKRGVIE